MMKRLGLILLLLLQTLLAAEQLPSEHELKTMIARMLVVGFDGQELNKHSDIYRYISEYELGGVILFDKDYYARDKIKNIQSPAQLQKLTADLQSISPRPLIISIDQEGGKVARLKSASGFSTTPSADDIAQERNGTYARQMYDTLAKELHSNGITCNFAPVVDLAVNFNNKVIYQLKRAYSKQPQTVIRYAKIFMESLNREGVMSVLKHFPGHGSSLDDSHEGFVDITNTWSYKELEPYEELIDEGSVDMIMTAHVFNSKLDKQYPATLSYNVNTKLLREHLGYKGVIISDDMQMKAISKQYDLKEAVTLAINAGVDILLFGNQLAHQNLGKLLDVIYKQVLAGDIPLSRIIESNVRIASLLNQFNKSDAIISKPIDFTPNRFELTRQYIQEHYDLNVTDITIDPKVIVLHWTAVTDLNDSFKRLKPDELYTDRKDISSAGLLNVSAHFLVDREGTIYQLMPQNHMARHVIGLNYSSIGIENVGGENNDKEDLTQAQVDANVALVRYLKHKYPGIEYLIGHHEYQAMEQTPLWLERDALYRTVKKDPGENFMKRVRERVRALELKNAPDVN